MQVLAARVAVLVAKGVPVSEARAALVTAAENIVNVKTTGPRYARTVIKIGNL